MRDTLARIVSFIGIFIVSAFIFSANMSRGNTTTTTKMGETTLPVVAVMYNGTESNTMYGLVTEPDLTKYRGDLSPLGEGRTLGIKIKRCGADITGITSEVRTTDGSRLIEANEIKDFSDQNGDIYATVKLKDLIEDRIEYSLCIVLTLADGKKARYYTRVISDDSLHASEMITFAANFSDVTMDKDNASVVAPYLESNASGDNSSYAHVDIHSSYDQVTWGDLNPKRIVAPTVRLLDISGDIGALMITFRVSCGIDDKDSEYDIEEYYRVRYSDERMYLLDYERTMNEVFTAGKSSFANDKIILGIHDRNFQLAENNAGDSIAFVTGGNLFVYKADGSRIAKAFSFTDEDHDDERTRCRGYDIKILSVDEGGNVRFLVYGRHNRGDHEGQVCAVVYYYDSSLNMVMEEAIVPYNGSGEMLGADIRTLSYMDRSGIFYLYLDGQIYSIDVARKTATILASGVAFDETASSASSRIGAFVSRESVGAGSSDDSTEYADTIKLIDMSDGSTKEIKADPGHKIRLLGFIGEDLVSGQIDLNDKSVTPLGVTYTPMSVLRITGSDGKVKKDYSESGYYISGVEIDGSTINIERVRRSEENGAYVPADSTQIMSSVAEGSAMNRIIVAPTEQRENIIEIQLVNEITVERLQLLTPDLALYEGDRTVVAEEGAIAGNKGYLVYSKGEIQSAGSDAGEALTEASDSAGIVLSMNNEYIWRKGSRESKHNIEELGELKGSGENGALCACLDAMLYYAGSGATTEEMLAAGAASDTFLQSNIDGYVLSLRGIKLVDVLYYVSKDSPVIASTPGGPVMITGYDLKNTIIYDPSLGITHYVGMNDTAEMLEEAGNEFLTYIKE